MVMADPFVWAILPCHGWSPRPDMLSFLAPWRLCSFLRATRKLTATRALAGLLPTTRPELRRPPSGQLGRERHNRKTVTLHRQSPGSIENASLLLCGHLNNCAWAPVRHFERCWPIVAGQTQLQPG